MRLDDVPTQRDVELTVDGITFAEPYLPLYSYDQETWVHVAAQNVERIDKALLAAF